MTGIVNSTQLADYTGKRWTQYFQALDALDAHSLTIEQIVNRLIDVYQLDQAWAEAIAIGYRLQDNTWSSG
ncbi:MAG: hypothetical protein D6737_20675 [Chloroflexi bacterium]|nr:MAG: hypothetical protein D6737_20675 [Chloroflexota bacterium]